MPPEPIRPTPPIPPTTTLSNRLVVVEQIVHQTEDTQPVVVESRWVHPLIDDEQPYARTLKLGPDWIPIDTGWLKSYSMLHIWNHGPGILGLATRDLLFCEIPIGETIRLFPTNLTTWIMRGPTKATLTLFPA